jgi:short-subunit dehydrogenase
MARRTLTGLRVLVTGASQGIGRSLAIAAVKRGCKVLATARSAQLLDELANEVRAAGGAVETLVADVTSPTDRQAMLDTSRQRLGGLDVLVNNAGVGATGHFMDVKPESLRQIFETNYFGPAELIRLFLPTLKQGTTPCIVNVSSVLGRRAWPARGLYSASKFAVQGLSDAIRAELTKDGIDVLVVNPGLTKTNFSKNLLENKAKLPMEHMRGMSSDAVAEATLRALAAGKDEIALTFRGKLLIYAGRFVPKVIDFFAKRRIRKLFAEEIAARKGQPTA